jgi:hypothetical protein
VAKIAAQTLSSENFTGSQSRDTGKNHTAIKTMAAVNAQGRHNPASSTPTLALVEGQSSQRKRIIFSTVPRAAKGSRTPIHRAQVSGKNSRLLLSAVLAIAPLVNGAPAKVRAGMIMPTRTQATSKRPRAA